MMVETLAFTERGGRGRTLMVMPRSAPVPSRSIVAAPSCMHFADLGLLPV